jgi:hypothetical protein
VALSGDERRAAALDTMYDRFDAVAARVNDVYGLRLPRHAAVGAAFFASLGRGALADIVRVHYLNRDLRSVQVLVAPGGPDSAA